MMGCEDATGLPALLLHLPDKDKTIESSSARIDSYRSLVQQRGYAWLCKPGGPFASDIQAEIEQAIKNPDGMCLYLFVRQSLDSRTAIIFRGRLLDFQGSGTNSDRAHLLPGMGKRSCGAWLKVTDLQRAPDELADRLCEIRTGLLPGIWTDFRREVYLVTDSGSEPVAEVARTTWLLCMSQPRIKAEFDKSWRFRPVATYQPGSPEFITACMDGPAPAVFVYDRVFGSPTRLKVVGVYEAEGLTPQGTEAGALVYVLQLRENVRFDIPLTLDPTTGDELWTALKIDPSDWEALTAGDRVVLPLTENGFERILVAAGVKDATTAQSALKTATASKAGRQTAPQPRPSDEPQFQRAFAQLEELMSPPAQALNEAQCYVLLRALENAMRQFIDRELSRVSVDWWVEGRTPKESKTRAEQRRQKRENPFPWVEQQGLSTREYLDFSDYAEIITMTRNWNDVFQQIFIQPDVIRGKLTELGIFRNDIAHMRPLQPGDKAIFVAYAWQLMRLFRDRDSIA